MRSKESIGTLEIYTHGVRILGVDDRVKVAARRVLNNWIVKGERKVENFRGDMVTEEFVSQIYGANFANNNDFWLHKGQMREFETELQVMGLHPDDFVIKVAPSYTPDKVKFKLKENRILRDYQKEARQFALDPVKEGDHFSKLIAMPTGTGKMQPNSAKVKTPDGWKRIDELDAGDEVYSPDGSLTVVTGYYVQGIKEVYRIRLTDGRSTRAGLSHMWDYWVDGDKKHADTAEMRQDLLSGKEVCTPRFLGGLDSPVESIEFVNFEDSRCIEVDADNGQYVTDDNIVTHNTVTACGTAAELGERWIIAVLPKYAKKWAKDLDDNLDVGPKGIMVVEKTTQLRGLIDMCKTQGTKKLPPTIVITLSTLRSFYELYREDADECVENMGCAPWELGRILKAGMLTIDEAHEHINTVFLTSMYLHGLKFVSLSGTMRTEDAFQERVQNIVFPQIKRYTQVKMERYIDVEFISYGFDPQILPRIRYQAFGRTDYNHPTFEASIMKYPAVLNGYLNIITDLLDFDYIPRRANKRALVFVGTVELADKVLFRLRTKYPHLNIARYCAAQGDKYTDLMTADITVSTLQSSGTAVDIENLISVICTTLVNSSKTNIQCLGRLRKLPNDEKVTMYMPYCRQNPKHLKYMAFRYELFKDITKSIKTFNYDAVLGRQ